MINNLRFKYASWKRTKGDREALNKYYRSIGMRVGNNCNICSNIITSEPYLIDISDNVVISYGVTFITHDASIGTVLGKRYVDLYGKIVIGTYSFIGSNSTILPNVILGPKTIVAAGSVVTKSFPDGGVVIGGNPAKVICTTEDFILRHQDDIIDTNNLSCNQKKSLIVSKFYDE